MIVTVVIDWAANAVACSAAAVRRCGCRLVLLACGLALSVLGGPFAPEAWAGCGDWLAHGAAEASSRLAVAAAGPIVDFWAVPLAAPSGGRQPCDGPQCRRAADPPTMPVPVRADRPARDAAETGLAEHSASPAVVRCGRAPDDLSASRGFPARIERPPRS